MTAVTRPGSASGPYPMGLMGLLATVGMLFAAFTAALLVRRTGEDWTPLALPALVWFGLAAIVLSSGMLEGARQRLRSGELSSASRWLLGAGLLGMLFLAVQVATWRRLAAEGVFLPSNPRASFFYMLSAVHGLHIVGGLGALAFSWRRLGAGAYTAARHAGFIHASIFWHFVGGLWAYLLGLLSLL